MKEVLFGVSSRRALQTSVLFEKLSELDGSLLTNKLNHININSFLFATRWISVVSNNVFGELSLEHNTKTIALGGYHIWWRRKSELYFVFICWMFNLREEYWKRLLWVLKKAKEKGWPFDDSSKKKNGKF